MANTKISGIVIAESNMGDFDKMLTILTPNYGKISCSARGARRPKSQLLAGTQLLCFGEYMVFKGSETYTINSHVYEKNKHQNYLPVVCPVNRKYLRVGTNNS